MSLSIELLTKLKDTGVNSAAEEFQQGQPVDPRRFDDLPDEAKAALLELARACIQDAPVFPSEQIIIE